MDPRMSESRPFRGFLVLVLRLLFVFGDMQIGVSGQCFGGIETFEKVSSLTFTESGQPLLSQSGIAVMRDCIAVCRQTSACDGFFLDYQTSKCVSYTRDFLSQKQFFNRKMGNSYFERICLRGVSNFNAICGEKLWAFERVPGYFLDGSDDKEFGDVQTSTECEKLCLEETTFVCRSADYDYDMKICKLSREDRRTQPDALKPSDREKRIDYLENQCVKSLSNCRYSYRNNTAAIVTDQVEFAQTNSECEALCDQSRSFICRSFSFVAAENKCYLSGDDSTSLVDPWNPGSDQLATLTKVGSTYAEKACIVSQCENGIFTFEKVSAHFLRTAREDPLLPSGPNDLVSAAVGATVECGRLCLESGQDCPAFVVDYTNGRCFKLDKNAEGRSDELTPKDGRNYFEKVCLKGNVAPCRDKAWAFERRIGKQLVGKEGKSLKNVQSRQECQEACLQETRLLCRSATYDALSHECFLSSSSRRGDPSSYLDASSHVEYLENQCVPEADCQFNVTENAYPRYLDAVIPEVTTELECQRRCDSHRSFNCRSYAHYSPANQCFLSGDDTVSANSMARQVRPGTVYSEKTCSDQSLQKPDSYTTRDWFFQSSAYKTTERPSTSYSPLPSRPTFGYRVDSGNEGWENRGTNSTAERAGEEGRVGPNVISVYSGDGRKSLVPRGPDGKCRTGNLEFERCTGIQIVTDPSSRERSRRTYRENSPGLLGSCTRRCESQPNCLGFNVDLGRHECQVVEGNLSSVKEAPGSVFYESVCLKAHGCGQRWTFEKVPNHELRDRYTREIAKDVSRNDCMDLCLSARNFLCRSASYDNEKRECHLSSEDRQTEPLSFRSANYVDYLENQCVTDRYECFYKRSEDGKSTLYPDRPVRAGSESECKKSCEIEREFKCRSYTFLSQTPPTGLNCLLSSVSSATYRGDVTGNVPGAIYTEKVCTSSVSSPTKPARETTVYRNLYGQGTTAGSDFRVPGQGVFGSYPSEASRTPSHGFENRVVPFEPSFAAGGSNYYPGGRETLDYTRRGLDRQSTPTNIVVYDYNDSGDSWKNTQRPAVDPPRLLTPPESSVSVGGGVRIGNVGSQQDKVFTGRDVIYIRGDRNYPQTGTGNKPEASGDGRSQSPQERQLPRDPWTGGGVASGGSFRPAAVSGCRYPVTYEKSANTDVPSLRRTELQVRGEFGLTMECIRECDRLGDKCTALLIEPTRGPRHRCFALERPAATEELVPTAGTMYYEKMCLEEHSCTKAWTFVRVPGFQLEGTIMRTVQRVGTKEVCLSACLKAGSLCRSVIFSQREATCRLSSDTRRTPGAELRPGGGGVDYFENQCVPDPPHCTYATYDGRWLPMIDRVLPASSPSISECKRLCDMERDFVCRSASLQKQQNMCLLSADDSFSSGGAATLMPDPNFIYTEKSSCDNVRVECTNSDMVVSVSFPAPFQGRVFSTGNPQVCFEVGNSQSQLTLRIPLGPQCGTVQQTKGRYVNNIVIQNNPVIMQSSDKTVRVECTFDAADQTLTYQSGVGGRAGDGVLSGGIDVTIPNRANSASVVSNTAPTPSVRMRIVSRGGGQDVGVVGLGDPLTLRMEVDSSSAFAIFARNVEARTDNGEVMTLVDSKGCPRDPLIFSPLTVERGSKNLFSEFRAFRFPSTATVHFVATVAFCPDQCEPVRCSGNSESFGRRRRSVSNSSEPVDEPWSTANPFESTTVLSDSVHMVTDHLPVESADAENTQNSDLDDQSLLHAGKLRIATESSANSTAETTETEILEMAGGRNELLPGDWPPPFAEKKQLEIEKDSSPKTKETTPPFDEETREREEEIDFSDGERSEVPVPGEMPLQLMLVVAPDYSATKREKLNYDPEVENYSLRRDYAVRQTAADDTESPCQANNLVWGSVIAAILVNVAAVCAFLIIYTKKKNKLLKHLRERERLESARENVIYRKPYSAGTMPTVGKLRSIPSLTNIFNDTPAVSLDS